MYSTTATDASNYVSTFNTSFYFILVISFIFLIGLTFTMLYFVFKYNKKKNKTATQIEGSTLLEITWTVIPTLLALVMFYFGWAGWKPMTKAPKDAMNITSIARMWSFSFLYENGRQSPDLIIPVNTPVKIKLTSLDVIHSLYVPAFRIKSDMVPGREKVMWFLPERVGEYDLFCAEYCGLRHSYMNAKVKVLSKANFDSWYTDTIKLIKAVEGSVPGSEGLEIMKANGCNACHSTDGSRIVGPTYLNLWGEQQVVIRDGREVTLKVDEEYIKRAIYDPNFEIVKGYPKGLMQSYKNTVSDSDIAKIIEFLKTLNEKQTQK
ncbi:MAG: cytochrome c oxidase subunit II [Bacteroidetes bacterium]|nr:MAG: cytochrome c oxidase subunit II [Bacteroidota bacterium]